MSALNVVVMPSGVAVCTDGVYYWGADLTIGRFGAKVMTLPHISAAVATVGPAGLTHLLGDVLYHEASDLDGLVESAAVAAAVSHASRVMEGVPARIVIAGVSPKHGPAAWHLVGDRLERIPGNFYTSPTVDFEPSWDSMATFESAMVELVERQRQAYPVGGFVALTMIGAGGITQKILHWFPDRIGDPIGPRQTDEDAADSGDRPYS
jgi:hypothetical protein